MTWLWLWLLLVIAVGWWIWTSVGFGKYQEPREQTKAYKVFSARGPAVRSHEPRTASTERR